MLAEGRLTVEITTGGALTWIENSFDAELLAESVAMMVNEKRPGAVGVPEMLPVEPSVNPAGREPALMLKEIAPVPPKALTDAL